MPEKSESIKVGEKTPSFCLPDGLSGEEVCLEDYLGSPLYLIFLRGSW